MIETILAILLGLSVATFVISFAIMTDYFDEVFELSLFLSALFTVFLVIVHVNNNDKQRVWISPAQLATESCQAHSGIRGTDSQADYNILVTCNDNYIVYIPNGEYRKKGE